MFQGVVYLKKDFKHIGRLSVQTSDGRFFRLKVRKDHPLFAVYLKCEIGTLVEWGGTKHFKIISKGVEPDET